MNQIYCSNCGQDIPVNSNFCKFCGAPQHGEAAGAYRVKAPAMLTPEEARAAAIAKPRRKVELFKRQHLGPDAILYFFIAYVNKTILLLGLCLVGVFLMPQIFVFGILAYLFVMFLGALFTYNNFTFEINETSINIDSGVINKAEVSVNFTEIENVNIERTLLNRTLGVAVVSIETAGNSSGTGGSNGKQGSLDRLKPEAYLPGLRLDVAKKVHDLLIDGSDGILGN